MQFVFRTHIHRVKTFNPTTTCIQYVQYFNYIVLRNRKWVTNMLPPYSPIFTHAFHTINVETGFSISFIILLLISAHFSKHDSQVCCEYSKSHFYIMSLFSQLRYFSKQLSSFCHQMHLGHFKSFNNGCQSRLFYSINILSCIIKAMSLK
jgi:hypothetical protein